MHRPTTPHEVRQPAAGWRGSLADPARAALHAAWRECIAAGSADASACTLFFAASCGTERAHVSVGRGRDFDAAWDAGIAALERLWRRKGRTPVWLRVELAHNLRETTWERLRKQFAATKRNYWRYGIAFDAGLAQALLPMECAGNALLYDGRFPVATPNDANLKVYAQRRFGRELRWPGEPAQPMWLFDTRAVFSDGKAMHAIEHEGRHHGYRHIDDWGTGRIREIVHRGTGYLARQVKPDGEYHYGWFPCFDRSIPTYNALRHASSTYALLEGWELTGDPAHKAAIDAALDYLCGTLIREAMLPDGTRAAFLVDTGDEIKLGGNAVCLLALTKHAELSGDHRHLPLLEKLALGILHMQDPQSGRFVHVLDWPDLGVKQHNRTIYYDGEAAFGLMRLYGLTGDPRWLAVVEKAFGHFIAAEHWRAHDHWLGYCVNELTLHRPDDRYYRFGLDNVRGYLDFVLERITTFPTLLEMMMAARRMIDRIQADPAYAHLLDGFDLDKFQRALEFRARYLLAGFFWPELAMFFRNPARVADGFFIKHHGYRVRIDDVEHYLSGLIAYWKYLDETGAEPMRNAISPHSADTAQPPEPVLPADLQGQENGKLDRSLLRPVFGGRLHWRAAQAWEAMRAAAQADGVLLEPKHCIDTYRPLPVQVRLFERRYAGTATGRSPAVEWNGQRWWLKHGAMPASVPGTSMHGWGLAVDVDRAQQATRMAWLRGNAQRFGWRWLVSEEPWHLCYCSGDRLPEAVAIHVGEEQLWAKAGVARGWDAQAVLAATGGTWLRQPAQDWRATGLCFWSPSMRAGQMVVLRFDGDALGLNPASLARLPAAPSAVIVDADRVDDVDAGIPVLRVRDRKRAVLAMGAFARTHMPGKLVGVTGSAGKTTTVAMLADVLHAYGATNRTRHNANLPPGIAWNLASMDWSAPYTVLEMAIGRMGESARMARPDVALVTNVTAAHLKYHGSVDEVARRKARIFSGMLPGGIAVLNRDLPQWRIFAREAARYGLRVIHYGRDAEASARLIGLDAGRNEVHAEILGHELRYRLGAPGEHMALNSLACLAVVAGLGLPMEPALPQLSAFRPLAGRGATHELELEGRRLRLIDEAYNANPASMAAALQLARDAQPATAGGRRVLVLGDMRELEPESESLHAALAPAVLAAHPDLVLLCGGYMTHLARALEGQVPLHWFADVEALKQAAPGFLEDGDLVLVKSSAGTRLSELVDLLLSKAEPKAGEGTDT
ncbi:hypothetical protein GCM10027084_01250 [Pseudoxanthomonas sangjuensis]|uniref:Mur ligase family protein n=1 Tax=Pseudoxanthomonas sangjuensis TaxID=1503750 RepID=UPI0013917F30|nr:Mur ligase family protein [Pseudoxanthomonas sangjuensis]KAF1707524.1 hypothetical protein CSC71_12950 [Pseudoxanthomonas sangjuensis]